MPHDPEVLNGDHSHPAGAGGSSDCHRASDLSLLRMLEGGSQDAATQLYVRYAHRLRALAQAQCASDLQRLVEADDIVQSVFRSFFRGASRGYYDVPPGQELWQLLLVITLNKIRAVGAFHRAAKRDVGITTGGDAIARLAENDAAQPQGDESLVFLRLTIEEVLEPLPEANRRIVELRIEGFEVAEIAQKLGRSKRTVERVLQQFRSSLRQALDAGG